MIYYIIGFYVLGFLVLDVLVRFFNDDSSAGLAEFFYQDDTIKERSFMIFLVIINWVSITATLLALIVYITRRIQYTKMWVNINSFKIYEYFCVNGNEEIKDELEADYRDFMKSKQILDNYRNDTILSFLNRIKYTTIFGDKIKIDQSYCTIDKA